MNDRKKIGVLLLAGLVVLSAMMVLATPAVAEEEEDPVLWVVPENPTVYVGTNPNDDLLNETLIAEVDMGLTFSSNVSVFYQAGSVSQAEDVNLTFFVHDASNIENITIGTAKRFESGTLTMDTNSGSNPNVETLTFVWGPKVKKYPPPDGFHVRYLIGDIPFSGGPSVTGNYNVSITNFHPDDALCYIKVPFTINFSTEPEQGFIVYVYANNTLSGQDWAHVAWSHDGAFYQGVIPEFTTIAIPVAAVLGLLFFFNHRKKRRE